MIRMIVKNEDKIRANKLLGLVEDNDVPKKKLEENKKCEIL